MVLHIFKLTEVISYCIILLQLVSPAPFDACSSGLFILTSVEYVVVEIYFIV